mmetsp:Transcript_46360/g.122401  ORF Transcript_46360/g.122401 Transcript_46360/m.122401 type:complete len:315 (-) Transcript_46360:493-1437(-)
MSALQSSKNIAIGTASVGGHPADATSRRGVTLAPDKSPAALSRSSGVCSLHIFSTSRTDPRLLSGSRACLIALDVIKRLSSRYQRPGFRRIRPTCASSEHIGATIPSICLPPPSSLFPGTSSRRLQRAATSTAHCISVIPSSSDKSTAAFAASKARAILHAAPASHLLSTEKTAPKIGVLRNPGAPSAFGRFTSAFLCSNRATIFSFPAIAAAKSGVSMPPPLMSPFLASKKCMLSSAPACAAECINVPLVTGSNTDINSAGSVESAMSTSTGTFSSLAARCSICSKIATTAGGKCRRSAGVSGKAISARSSSV